MTARVIGVLGSSLLIGCSVFGIRSGTEQPSYEVVDRLDRGIEIRRYGPRLAAETTVAVGDADESMNDAFRILAAYIFAKNRSGEGVSMTAPVEVGSVAEPIAMTAPVATSSEPDGRLRMRFFMPRQYTRATLPKPADERVEIVELPETTVAVLRFSGRGRAAAAAERRAELLAALESSDWTAIGDPSTLTYDPPWTIPFLRRNEAVVTVRAERPDPVGDYRSEGP